jgi:hypothetical protein
MATYIKSTCVECQARVPCATCGLYEAYYFDSYTENPNSLPDSIYFGGTRSYTAGQALGLIPNDPPINVTLWGGVTGGTLLSRSGISYGDTTNGAIIEIVNGVRWWAIYNNSVRSLSVNLIDGVHRHDAFPSSYQVSGPDSYTVYRTSCVDWNPLRFGGYCYAAFGCLSSLPSWFTKPSSAYVDYGALGPGFSLGFNGTTGRTTSILGVGESITTYYAEYDVGTHDVCGEWGSSLLYTLCTLSTGWRSKDNNNTGIAGSWDEGRWIVS